VGWTPGPSLAGMLKPNPPRMVTVVIAVALIVGGFVLAWPIPALVDLLTPLEEIVAEFGGDLSPETGYLAMVVGDGLLVAGSLMRGL
jgi:hypothetical protein